jgi:hypothetical protein
LWLLPPADAPYKHQISSSSYSPCPAWLCPFTLFGGLVLTYLPHCCSRLGEESYL